MSSCVWDNLCKGENDTLKRSRLCAALLCGAVGVSLLVTPALAAAPNDMRHHWAQTQVYTLMEHGIIAGYSDHTFRPDQAVTRQEAAGLVYTLLAQKGVDFQATELPVFGDSSQAQEEEVIPQVGGAQTTLPQEDEQVSQQAPDHSQDLSGQADSSTDSESPEESAESVPSTEDSTLPTYTDLDDSWAKDKILALEANGILPQDGTTLFHPFQNLTRGEAAMLLYNSIQRWPDQLPFTPLTTAVTSFSDMAGRPEEEAVNYLHQLGLVSGREDGCYHPDDSITRAEFSVLLLNLSGYPLMTDVQFDPLPVCTVIPTPYISQVYPSQAWVGCEPTSLLMGLKAKGYAQNVTLDQFLADMPKTSSNPAKGFVGSPYVPSETLRTTIYPAPLAAYGRRYGNVVDFSGKSVEELREEVLLGNPVVIYVTLYWKQPYYRNFNIEGTTQRLLRNNHAVLVCGYDASTQYYYIADPYNINDRYHDYFYWISADVLDPLYMVRQHAVAVE